MGDYEEQQAMEVEALQSILMDDLKEEDEANVPSGWKPISKVYKVEICPQASEEQVVDSHPVIAELVFSHTQSYPDEPPLLRARGVKGLSQFDTESLQSLVEATAEENAGMPMIYQLVTAMQEWVTEKANEVAAPARDPEAEIRKAREAEENRLAELRAHGTPVTPETFEAWRSKFEAELKFANSSLTSEPTTLVKPKLTGKAWFLQQEASHVEIIEPALEEDEEDGEGSRRSWSGDDEDENEDDFDLGSDDEDDVLDAYMSSAIPER